MKKLKPWLLILLVFVAGFTCGVVVTRAKVRSFLQRSVSHPETVRDLMENRMVRRLDLNEEQHRKVHGILVERQAQMKALRREFAPRFFEIVTAAEEEISGLLTPEQKERFEKLRGENRRLLSPIGN